MKNNISKSQIDFLLLIQKELINMDYIMEKLKKGCKCTSSCCKCSALKNIEEKNYFGACYWLIFEKKFDMIDHILFNIIPERCMDFSYLLERFNINEKLKYVEFASQNNDTRAHLCLAEMYEYGKQTKKNRKKGIELYKKYLYNSINKKDNDTIIDIDNLFDAIKYHDNIGRIIKKSYWFISQYNDHWSKSIDIFISFYDNSYISKTIFMDCFEKLLIRADYEIKFFQNLLGSDKRLYSDICSIIDKYIDNFYEKYKKGCLHFATLLQNTEDMEKAKTYLIKIKLYSTLYKIYKDQKDVSNVYKYGQLAIKNKQYEILGDIVIDYINGFYGEKNAEKAFFYIEVLCETKNSYGEQIFTLIDNMIKRKINYTPVLASKISNFVSDKIEPRINIIKNTCIQDRCPIFLSGSIIYEYGIGCEVNIDKARLYKILAKNHKFEEYI